jgi:hypothetical protein
LPPGEFVSISTLLKLSGSIEIMPRLHYIEWSYYSGEKSQKKHMILDETAIISGLLCNNGTKPCCQHDQFKMDPTLVDWGAKGVSCFDDIMLSRFFVMSAVLQDIARKICVLSFMMQVFIKCH